MTWQPIETAPKDGTQILASDGEIVSVIEWIGQDWYDYEAFDSAAFNPTYTYWKPLPEPPTEDE